MFTRSFRTSVQLLLFLTIFISQASAQFPYNESFKNTTAPGLVISGSARLTAAAAIDPAGQGYLRLNDNINNSVGYAYGLDSFPSNRGLNISFEFFSYKTGATLTNQADGMTFFLFDASVNAFRPGGSGGSLGYAQYYNTPGMAKGYIGISIDAFGNYSSATDGNKNGGPGQQRGSIAIRGPGNGKSSSDYVYQAGVIAGDPAYNAGFLGFTQRYPDPLTASYRKLNIILTPGSSLGSTIGYKITVIMYKGGAVLTPVTLLSNIDYPFAAPAQLQFGLAGSTGSITNYHEIRNMSILPAITAGLAAPTATNDNGTVACQGQHVLLAVTANDYSNNTGGTIQQGTIDLDPATPGRQTTFTDAGKGIYTAGSTGIVEFTPVSGYSGASTATYTVDDNYGQTTAAATISVTVSNITGPDLVMATPAPVCSPATIDLTNASYKLSSTPGAAYSYFNTLSDANNNINNINATAAAIPASGTYYVRAALSGCSTVRALTVQISTPPSTAYAGPDALGCTSVGNTTLVATNADIGTGSWSQVSGPSASTINYPDASTSLVTSMALGTYVYRWTVSMPGCPSSSDDVQIAISSAVTSVAGTNQTLCNATAATLQGNTPSLGTGAWTLGSGPSITINSPASPTSTLSGLTAGNSYTMAWKITNGGCTSTSSVIISSVANTIANAGADRDLGNVLSYNMAANTAGSGNTGAWSVVSTPPGGTAAFSQPASPVSAVTVSTHGDYQFKWTITNGTCSNEDLVRISNFSTLPVVWRSFTATPQQGHALLSWSTDLEAAGDRFTIERSTDAVQYVQRGSVAGTTAMALHTFSDSLDRTGPLFYYRLRYTDAGGQSAYSRTITVAATPGTDASLQWSPNPFTSQVHVSGNIEQASITTISIYTAAGGLVKRVLQPFPSGSNGFIINGLDKLSPGLYIVELCSGSRSYRHKMMKAQ